MREEQVGVCPSCGNKMEAGYVAALQIIAWSKKKASNWALRPFRDSEIIKSAPIRALVNVEAFHCLKCKLIQIKYGQTPDRDGTPESGKR